ncbi:MAG: hypothetical protein Q8941_08470 [Bacteroidota bacterium]|nr:hypothetical protein [Bacteroidota bacterium]
MTQISSDYLFSCFKPGYPTYLDPRIFTGRFFRLAQVTDEGRYLPGIKEKYNYLQFIIDNF